MDSKATTKKKVFSRETSIGTNINASAETIWQILTDASAYRDWNSTILSLEGDIVPGGKIKLVSKLDPKRTFKLSVKTFEPNQKLVWGDPMGKRTYLIKSTSEGTNFTMSEKIGGPLFPLFASKIPSFDESFETFAKDLKRVAEAK